MNARLERLVSTLAERYLGVDARSLALFRVFFGLHLIANAYDRTHGVDALAFYTNDGVLPNHFALFAPVAARQWSFFYPLSTLAEVYAGFAVVVVVYLAYILGYRTKLAQILVIVCLLSLTNRNLVLQNGGIVVTNLLATWTAFLPLGARFSIDALLKSLRERREDAPSLLNDRDAMAVAPSRYLRLAFLGVVLNFCCIYFLNYAHKRGLTWKDGSAVHWVLWQNRIATQWASMLRMHEPSWFSRAATYGTLATEGVLPVLMLLPAPENWARRAALACIFVLHGAIALTMTLGPFSYSMMSFSLLLVGPQDWAWLRRKLVCKRDRILVLYEPTLPKLHYAARVLARLDARQAFEFGDLNQRDAHGASLLAPSAHRFWAIAQGTPDGVLRSRARTGADAAYLLLRALPLGVLYAWLLQLPVVRWRVEQWIESLEAQTVLPGELEPLVRPAPFDRLRSAVWVWSGQALAGAFLVVAAIEIAADNWIIPERYRINERPRVVREIVDYLRLPQGWSMFSPDAPRHDGTIIIDAILSDGRHVDPRSQLPPDFDAAFHGPWYDDQQWCDWDLRMSFESNKKFYPYFGQYIAHLDRLASWKQRASIQSFEVYWVNNAAPPPGTVLPYDIQKTLLFTSAIQP